MTSIRRAVPADKPALDQVMWRASWSNESDRIFLAANRAMVQARSELIETTFVAVSEGQITGFAALEHLPDGWELDGLFVDPKHMRRGIASRLLDACANHAARDGADALWTTANMAALAFYHAAGFTLIDPHHKPGPRLRLDLPRP